MELSRRATRLRARAQTTTTRRTTRRTMMELELGRTVGQPSHTHTCHFRTAILLRRHGRGLPSAVAKGSARRRQFIEFTTARHLTNRRPSSRSSPAASPYSRATRRSISSSASSGSSARPASRHGRASPNSTTSKTSSPAGGPTRCSWRYPSCPTCRPICYRTSSATTPQRGTRRRTPWSTPSLRASAPSPSLP